MAVSCRTASAAALLLASSAVALGQDLCIYNAGNSTFNLRNFQSTSYYAVQDASNNPGSNNYTYFFNLCSNIDPWLQLPGWGPSVACNVTSGGIWRPSPTTSGPAPAFQYNSPAQGTPDACHRLGAPVSQATEQFGLYDPANPSRGLFIRYLGGDQCPGGNVFRSMKIWLLCDPDAVKVPATELVIEAPGSCLYEMYVRTAYGCPAECPVVKDPNGVGMLCSNHGFCDYDPAVGKSRCFCNDNYGNSDCSPVSSPPQGLSTVGAVLICVGLFLGATLGFLVYLWFRIRSLRLDPTAYSSLRAGPEEPHTDNGTAIQ